MTCQVHLASGIGNIVLATPLLQALGELGFSIDVYLDADCPQTADLLRPWSVVRQVHCGHGAGARAHVGYDILIPAIPPFYWQRFARHYQGSTRVVRRPPDALFARDEQAYYLAFARALGYPSDAEPTCSLPIAPLPDDSRASLGTIVLAPGCKTGRMAAKRWPFFASLADRFDDVVIVGTGDDLADHDGRPFRFPRHARSFVDRLTLRETAELMASAGVVVANDAGLGHVAGAVGTRTVMLFGPTGDRCLGKLPDNVTVMRAGLACEPCWTSAPLQACAGRVSCLATLSIDRVEQEIRRSMGPPLETLVDSTRSTEVG
jgi:ADP-heptose:LPS heptosyltransferase